MNFKDVFSFLEKKLKLAEAKVLVLENELFVRGNIEIETGKSRSKKLEFARYESDYVSHLIGELIEKLGE